jgi:2-oxoglutarate ferredoxin oxidoreductase subunit alpha
MTSSSSPGISLKQEGMSYAAGADVPLVLVNVVRGGPGLGSIAPSQADYFQSTRGGGHGDYYCLVLAPKSVQECADLTYEAFDLADKYRMPVIIQADGMLGQMMEGVVLPAEKAPGELPRRDWIVGNAGKEGRDARHITSIHLIPEELEEITRARYKRYEEIKTAETRFEYIAPGASASSGISRDGASFNPAGTTEGAQLTLVAYGTSARVCLGAKELAERAGFKIGLFRPVTLWPFPYQALGKIAASGNPILTVEMSLGQLVEDVKLSLLEAPENSPRAAVHLVGHSGGVIPTEEEVFAEIQKIIGTKDSNSGKGQSK